MVSKPYRQDSPVSTSTILNYRHTTPWLYLTPYVSDVRPDLGSHVCIASTSPAEPCLQTPCPAFLSVSSENLKKELPQIGSRASVYLIPLYSYNSYASQFNAKDIYMCVCAYLYMYLYIYTYIHVHIYYVSFYVYIYMCAYIHFFHFKLLLVQIFMLWSRLEAVHLLFSLWLYRSN